MHSHQDWPTLQSSREDLTSAPLAPRSKLPLLNHLRRRSNTSRPRARSTSYEAWIDTALFLAHNPEVVRSAEANMPRIRSGSVPNSDANRGRHVTEHEAQTPPIHSKDELPSIRLTVHQDSRSNRPSLNFPPTTRTLPHDDCVIRIGRYSERDVNPNPAPNMPSAAPVGFKSKVVSRRHCEFWCSQGQWFVRDVKSSSGTFLNHIRLSQPNIESRPYPVNDGDVIQLGIDFRGGEEMIFRCVKIRVECNRGWQKTLNKYNVSTHKRLRELGKTIPKQDSDAVSTHSSQECAICLMSIAPCQSLFVAPCSHVWHYKCIRPILNDHKTYPQFLCPNCRAITDLDADVDDPVDRWDNVEDLASGRNTEQSGGSATADPINGGLLRQLEATQVEEATEDLITSTSQALSVEESGYLTSNVTERSDYTSNLAPSTIAERRNVANGEHMDLRLSSVHSYTSRPHTPAAPLSIDTDTRRRTSQTPTMDMLVSEGPLTPTNTAGPFIFDGVAGTTSRRSTDEASAPA